MNRYVFEEGIRISATGRNCWRSPCGPLDGTERVKKSNIMIVALNLKDFRQFSV